MSKKTIVLSVFMVLVILSTGYYVLLPDKVRIDFQNTRNLYSVFENGNWELAATEYVYLFDGTSKMRAKNRSNYQIIQGDNLYIHKIANYKEGIIVEETLVFDTSSGDVKSFPKERTVLCHNCEGKIIQFELRDILYNGETKSITSPFSFGHKMKLEWQEGAYRQKVYQQKVASDKIILRYRPVESIETYRVRLFDPDTLTLHLPAANYFNDTQLQHSLFFNCSANFNVTQIDLYMTNSTNESFGLIDSVFFNINVTNSVANFTLLLHTGDYTWNCKAQNVTNTSVITWGTNRTFKLNATGFNFTFGTGITSLGYPVNYSILNWSAIINSTVILSGNYTWNFTELNISHFNLTDYLFIVTNTGYYNVSVYLNKSEDKPWYDWICNSLNITVNRVNLFNLTRGQKGFINCTLDLFNISQTYVNWTKTIDNASFNFSHSFTK